MLPGLGAARGPHQIGLALPTGLEELQFAAAIHPQLVGVGPAAAIPGQGVHRAGFHQPHLAAGVALWVAIGGGWLGSAVACQLALLPALAVELLVHDHAPIALSRLGQLAAAEAHPRCRARVVGEVRDAAWVEFAVQASYGAGASTPQVWRLPNRLDSRHQQKQHQGHRQGRQQHRQAAAQYRPPAQAAPHLQGQQPRQAQGCGQQLQQAGQQLPLLGTLHTAANQGEQAHQSPLRQAAGLGQLQASQQ